MTLAAGLQTIAELTPELFATALAGTAVLCLRDRRWFSIALLSLAALTRESMLVAAAAIGLYELVTTRGLVRVRVRRAAAFALPFGVYLAWSALLQQRLGTWPWTRSDNRLVAPFTGVADALGTGQRGAFVGFAIAVTLIVSAWLLARRDVLTWIATAYLAYAMTFSADVWLHGGVARTLVPLYVFGSIAVVGGWRARVPAADDPDHPRRQRLRVPERRPA